MTDDQLAKIKAWLAIERAPQSEPTTQRARNVLPDDWIDWLIAEVERLRGLGPPPKESR